jgi:RimJ/RimL family protein N-acetyltransferase
MSPLRTHRLLLRPLRLEDREWLVDLYVEAGGTRGDADREVVDALAHARDHGFGHIVVELTATGERVAIVELHRAGEGLVGIAPDEVEVGWVVAAEQRGKGIATEAAGAVAAHALEALGIDHLVAYVRPANARSLRVVDKLGMRRRGSGRSRSGDAVDVFELHSANAS